jgi:hypothetical protein
MSIISISKPLPPITSACDDDRPAPQESERERRERLRVAAYAIRFNPDEIPPPDETCMVIGDIPIAARGNLSVIQGKSKVGKSAVVAAVLAAAQRGNYHSDADSLCVSWTGESVGAIIHLDTEQSRAAWHALVRRSVTRSGMQEVSPRLVSLPLVMFARSERLAILREALEFEREAKGGIDLVVIDGIADLCISPNDEAESLELVSQCMALAQEFNTPIYCILHENPSSETNSPKTRGHLGSELNRKAFANLRIDKDAETSISTIFGTDMREREIPREHGFCFGWENHAGMHIFKGRATGMKAAAREAKATDKARDEWTKMFDHIRQNTAEIGTNLTCPDVSPEEAAEAERDIAGTSELTKTETMKKRMQRAETLGVLRKTTPGKWTIIESGQSGQMRDN